ncbi:MAG TPA: TonB family protein [Syntrophobacteraceae bacterium]|nr:TonB family protein [Syntrophobacteraceae bacterium]
MQTHPFPEGTAWSSLAATPVKSTVPDAQLDFSFLDDPPDFEILGFRLSQVPVLLERKTWSSLAAVILMHASLVCLLWLSPIHPAPVPKSIQVRLVSMPGGSELRQGIQEAGKDEQPAVLAPPPVQKEVPEPRPREIAKVTPRPKQYKEINTAQRTPQSESHPNQSESSPQPVVTGTGSTAEAGTGSGDYSGQGGTGSANGPRGASEITFGSPNGPSFLHKVLPAYPALARRLEKEGTVLLRVTIDERGRPVEVEVLNKAGFGFDEEAVKAVKDSTFTPAKIGGKPLACKALLPIRFILRNS